MMFVYICVSMIMGPLITWPMYRDQRANSGVDLDLPSCLRQRLVYDHNTLSVPILSNLTSWAGWSLLEGRHSLFPTHSRLPGSRSLRESPFSSYLFTGILGSQICTSGYMWVLRVYTCRLLKLIEAFVFAEPDGFLLKDSISQLALQSMEVISVPIRGGIPLLSVGKSISGCLLLSADTHKLVMDM